MMNRGSALVGLAPVVLVAGYWVVGSTSDEASSPVPPSTVPVADEAERAAVTSPTPSHEVGTTSTAVRTDTSEPSATTRAGQGARRVGRPARRPAPPGTKPPTTTTAIATHRADISVLAPVARAVPVRVEMPSVTADGPVISVGVDDKGELFVPPDAATLVWYGHGPAPGEPGSAVVAGHLDWDGQLGVFNRLSETAVGDLVTVTYDDGSARAFVVSAVELVPKPAVAVTGVFDRRGPPVLRLVTCGGEFDDATNHYRSNVVVTATPA